MSLKKLKVGIIGLGEQTKANLLPTLYLNKYIKITAICDIDVNALTEVANSYEIAESNRYTIYKEMIDLEDLDVVVVSSFPKVHFKVAKYAIERKLAVFVEKPPVSNINELYELIELTKRYGVKTGVGMNFSYTDCHETIMDIINQESFGALSFISVEHISSKPTAPLWHLDSTLESFLLAQLIHPLDYILTLGGTYHALHVHCSRHHNPLIVQIMIDFDNGMIGCLKSGSFYPRFKHMVEIISDNGSIVKVNDLSTIEVTTKDAATPFKLKSKHCSTIYTPSPLKSGYSKAGYQTELNKFFEHLLLGNPFHHSIEDLLPVYNALDEIKKYVEKRRELFIPSLVISEVSN